MDGLTIEEYLRGLVGLDVTDAALRSILAKRDIESGSEYSSLPKGLLDLCTADLYMWCANAPSIKGTIKDSDGGWSHSEGGSQVFETDKRHWRKMANDIYKRYGEYTPSSIRFINRGLKIW
jgi:hypothetical protein